MIDAFLGFIIIALLILLRVVIIAALILGVVVLFVFGFNLIFGVDLISLLPAV